MLLPYFCQFNITILPVFTRILTQYCYMLWKIIPPLSSGNAKLWTTMHSCNSMLSLSLGMWWWVANCRDSEFIWWSSCFVRFSYPYNQHTANKLVYTHLIYESNCSINMHNSYLLTLQRRMGPDSQPCTVLCYKFS